jgi:hypothetical protein
MYYMLIVVHDGVQAQSNRACNILQFCRVGLSLGILFFTISLTDFKPLTAMGLNPDRGFVLLHVTKLSSCLQNVGGSTQVSEVKAGKWPYE